MNNDSRRVPTELLSGLGKWYQHQCNGDWEHEFGIKIDTLDNPGWIVDIDLAETELQGKYEGRIERTASDTDWIDIAVSERKFLATGDALRLAEIISQFLYFVENKCLRDIELR